MELKKSEKANLEKLKFIFLLIGFVITIGTVYGFFNWRTDTGETEDLGQIEAVVDDELTEITRQDQAPPPEPEPEPQQQQAAEIIKIVEDDQVIEDDFDFDTEADDETEIEIKEIEEEEEDDNVVFLVVEKTPQFPGGDVALRNYISKNVHYPERAKENDIQGTVYLRFVVLKTGKVGSVEIQRGVDPLLDEEAKKVVKSLPRFTPGQQGGKKVNVWFSLPINFRLN